MTSVALDLAEGLFNVHHAQDLVALAQDAQVTEAPAPYLRVRAVRLLLRLFAPQMVPDDIARRSGAALGQDAHAMEGEAGMLLALLDLHDGIAKLEAALRSGVPLARTEAACALGLLACDEAFSVLSRSATPEAEAVRPILQGARPRERPEPQGEVIEWRGEERRVYSADEILDHGVPSLVASSFERTREKYAELLGATKP